MSVEQTFEHFFKPEAKRSGADYFAKNAVILSNKSDTHVQGYIKGVAAGRVSLSSTSIESISFSASCTCPVSNKGHFCKHIWAVLLSTEINYPDFLTSKTNIEKISKTNLKQDVYKEKQADYRKLQYQKQKLSAKKIKIEKEKKKFQDEAPKLPNDVESALVFFEENGFPIEKPIQEETLNNARKKLARVFHPDVGGSHKETVVLNENYDIILNFIRS
ncbi:MAG: SWIM zinc finger family protein [Bdellovibrionota bacterium]